jgi:putative transposase
MLRAFKYRIYPNSEQIQFLEKHFDFARLVYNLGLSARQLAYSGSKIHLSYNELNKQLNDLKSGFSFLREVNSQSLQSALRNLDVAFRKFFKKEAGFPKFKSKRGKQSFQCPQKVYVDFEKSELNLPKFKSGISIAMHRPFNGLIKTVAITKTSTNKYFASILVDTGVEPPAKPTPSKDRAIGIDVGLKNFITAGNIDLTRSFKIENPEYLRSEVELLARRQRQFSRKIKGSKNREKARLKVARFRERILNQRKDFLHKISYRLVNDSQVDTICIEDLNVKGMMKNHKLARAISDVAWGELFRQLRYKSDWTGKNLLKADRFSATSKDCHKCGYKNNSLTLEVRVWDCPSCGAPHDRDENAVPNIITSAFLKYNKNRDGLPELTLGESLPISLPKTRKRKARTKSQEKFQDNSTV